MGRKTRRYSLPVLVGSLLITFAISLFTRHHIITEAADKYDAEVKESLSSIEERLNIYMEVIRGARALYDADNSVSRGEWNRYYNSIEISKRYPGIRAIQLSRFIRHADKEKFIQRVKSDRSVKAEGYPDFKIEPAGEREYYVVVDYNEPFEQNALAHGFDAAYGQERKPVIEAARDTGAMTLTGKLDLLYGIPGLVMHFPIYKNELPRNSVSERREALEGFVSGVFNISDLMKGMLGNRLERKIHFQLFDLGPANANKEQPGESGKILLYSNGEEAGYQNSSDFEKLVFTNTMEIGGRTWQSVFQPKEDLSPNFYTNSALLVLIGGVFISMLLYMFVESLEKKGVAEALSVLSEKRFYDIVENSNEMIWELDAEGKYTYVSPVIEKLLGYKPAELTGNHYLNFFEGDTNSGFKKTVEKNFQTQTPFRSFVARHLSKKGHIVYLEFSGVPVTDKQGAFLGYRGSARDVTKIKNAVKEMRKARDSAEEANRFKSEFLANISHELNTPLNSIIGFSNLLSKTELDERQRKFSDMIKGSSAKLLSLINEILELSNSEFGESYISESEFNLMDLIDSNIAGVEKELLNKKIQMEISIGENTPTLLKGDAGKLSRIIKMILSNAVKFTETGRIVFMAELHEKNGKSAKYHFAIKDSGIGIPEDKKDAIFQAFKQVDGSITRKFGGIGIGLATSKRLIEIMGGEIWFESQEGIGSTFHFICPLSIISS
ncbi:MAG: CHASE domain-containing protein [Nitrospinota bacterium]|nr:CHASE domain-containing protein [Nitrospinota bacterium]